MRILCVFRSRRTHFFTIKLLFLEHLTKTLIAMVGTCTHERFPPPQSGIRSSVLRFQRFGCWTRDRAEKRFAAEWLAGVKFRYTYIRISYRLSCHHDSPVGFHFDRVSPIRRTSASSKRTVDVRTTTAIVLCSTHGNTCRGSTQACWTS
jgi:hypothetical protein